MLLGYIIFLSFTLGLTACVLFLQCMYCYSVNSKKLELQQIDPSDRTRTCDPRIKSPVL